LSPAIEVVGQEGYRSLQYPVYRGGEMTINVKPTGPFADDWACARLHEAIELDGRSVKDYAEQFLFCSYSSVYKWLRGENRVPQVYRKMLSPVLAEYDSVSEVA
jgi:hypothetical protein